MEGGVCVERGGGGGGREGRAGETRTPGPDTCTIPEAGGTNPPEAVTTFLLWLGAGWGVGGGDDCSLIPPVSGTSINRLQVFCFPLPLLVVFVEVVVVVVLWLV